MSKVTAKYEDGLKTELADPFEAVAYLNAALEEGSQDSFLLALGDVTEALGQHFNKDNIEKIAFPQGSPQLSSLNTLLHSMGLRLAVEVQYT